jgi:hypothetical protein
MYIGVSRFKGPKPRHALSLRKATIGISLSANTHRHIAMWTSAHIYIPSAYDTLPTVFHHRQQRLGGWQKKERKVVWRYWGLYVGGHGWQHRRCAVDILSLCQQKLSVHTKKLACRKVCRLSLSVKPAKWLSEELSGKPKTIPSASMTKHYSMQTRCRRPLACPHN